MDNNNEKNNSLFSSRLSEAVARQTKTEKLPSGKYTGTVNARIEKVKNRESVNYGREKLVVYLRVAEGAQKGKVTVLDWVLSPAHLEVPERNTEVDLKAHNASVAQHYDALCKIFNNIGIETVDKSEAEIFAAVESVKSKVEFNVVQDDRSYRIYINKLIEKITSATESGSSENQEEFSFNYLPGDEAPFGKL